MWPLSLIVVSDRSSSRQNQDMDLSPSSMGKLWCITYSRYSSCFECTASSTQTCDHLSAAKSKGGDGATRLQIACVASSREEA